MNIITGGTGHVGSALAEVLLQKGESVTIVSRSSKDAKEWTDKGAQIAVADVYDTAALHDIFKTGKAVFILNPPADPATDTDKQEKKTAHSLLDALTNSGVEKVVVESTMGAQPGDNIGDLSVLYELEQGISKLSYPYSIIRPAYYMSNWAQGLEVIKQKGELMSLYPADMKMPMVAPKDIAELAAHLLTQKNTPEINTIAGPELYSPNDVAAAFSKALGKKVMVKVVPEEGIKASFESLGFSSEAAESFTRMTQTSLKAFGQPADETGWIKGKTTLQAFVDELVKS